MQHKTSRPVETMLGIATGFTLLYWWFGAAWLLYVAIAAGLIGLFSKGLARKVEWAWLKLTRLIGFINARIILGLIFFLFLWPLALLWRLGRRDPLQIKKKNKSYFKDRNHTFRAEDLEDPW